MCGSENRLYKAKIEGTILNVCKYCAKFGKVVANVHDKKFIEKIQKERTAIAPISKEEMAEAIVEDFAKIIKEKRESLNLKQEDFAKKINEKVSLIHKLETGSFEPSMILARKIEKFLRVRLIEQQSTGNIQVEHTKSGSFTLGDFIKIKQR